MSQYEADVIIVSAGPSGLSAAISAAQAGAKVIAFEKGSTTGGAGNMGMGPFAVESDIQKLGQKGPSKEKAFEMFMDYVHWRADAKLVRAYIEKSTSTISWLQDMGVEFVDAAAYFPGGEATWHIVKPAIGKPGPMAAATMYKIMTDKAKELGVEIYLQTPVKKLIKKGDSVVGVVAENASGDKVEASAKAVIVATGGFGDSPQMIKKHAGYEWGKDMHSFRIPGLTGDGIKMAWQAGAMPTDMGMEMIYNIPAEVEPPIMMMFNQPHLMVNLQGERFINEGIMYNTTFTGNAISFQKDKTAYLIFDDTIKTHMETVGFDHASLVFPMLKIENIEEMIKGSIAADHNVLHIAESLDELAEQTGIDAEGLKSTVESYNRFCAQGYDEEFNKEHRLLRPLKAPKYYAAKFLPSAYGSLGGIKINHKTEVLDKKWNKIPGLYAGGTDANSIYGDSYPFILPGNTMGFALNSGRIAGENAAEYAKSQG